MDTSVWVAVLRSRAAPEAFALAALLDADAVILPVPVRVELLLGAPARERTRLRRALSALPIAYPVEETWTRVEGWAESAAGAGHRFGVGDLLIAAVASERNALVWSLDRGFARLERLKVVSLYEPKVGAGGRNRTDTGR